MNVNNNMSLKNKIEILKIVSYFFATIKKGNGINILFVLLSKLILAASIPVNFIVTLQVIKKTYTWNVISEGISSLAIIITFMLFVQFFFVTFRVVDKLLFSNYEQHALQNLEEIIIRKTERLPYETLENEISTQSFQRQLTLQKSLEFYNSLLSAIQYILTIAASFFVFIHFNWRLIFILSIYLIPAFMNQKFIGGIKYHFFKRQSTINRTINYLSSLLVEKQSVKEVRTFGLTSFFLERWIQLSKLKILDQRNADKKAAVSELISESITYIITLSIVTYLLVLVSKTMLSISEFVSSIMVVAMYRNNFQNIGGIIATIKENYKYLTDFNRILSLKNKSNENSEMLFPAILMNGISINNLSYKYANNNNYALTDITFKIHPGEKVAIVGSNGAGKTTLVKCLLGLYEPQTGTITFDNIDINTFMENSFKKNVTAVFQDFMRYQLTARENIGVGDIRKINDILSIQSAARKADIEDFINSLPRNFETELGFFDMNRRDLSQGQWQRIALSRAYLNDAQVIILDEPTASLDPLTEATFYNQYFKLSEGKTSVIITHRLGSCRYVDNIVVLKNGKMVEYGNHKQLMYNKSEYYEMYHNQSKWYEKKKIREEHVM